MPAGACSPGVNRPLGFVGYRHGMRRSVQVPLSAQPSGYFLARAAELREMATTARSLDVAAALTRLAKRFEALAAKRLGLPDEEGSA